MTARTPIVLALQSFSRSRAFRRGTFRHAMALGAAYRHRARAAALRGDLAAVRHYAWTSDNFRAEARDRARWTAE